MIMPLYLNYRHRYIHLIYPILHTGLATVQLFLTSKSCSINHVTFSM